MHVAPRLERVAFGSGRLTMPQLAEPTTRTFVLSFDFEDWHQLVHRRIGRPDWRDGSAEFEQHVSTLLDLLDELGVSATFFVAGVTADRHPGALTEVVGEGTRARPVTATSIAGRSGRLPTSSDGTSSAPSTRSSASAG